MQPTCRAPPARAQASQHHLLHSLLQLGCNVTLHTDVVSAEVRALQARFNPASSGPTTPAFEIKEQLLALVEDPHAPLPATSLGAVLRKHAVAAQQQQPPARASR